MVNSLRLRGRIHYVIDLAGFSLVCFGILIIASALKLQHFELADTRTLWAFPPITCQYWAGIPTILTGAVLIVTVKNKQRPFLKYVSMCCILITMVVTFGVIIQETVNHADINRIIAEDTVCPKIQGITEGSEGVTQRQKECAKLREASPWYYTLLFTADFVLVFSTFALLVFFADWILFLAQKVPYNEMSLQPPYGDTYAGNPTPSGQYQNMPNVQCDQNTVQLHRV